MEKQANDGKEIKQFTFRLNNDLYKVIKEKALQAKRSLNSEILKSLEEKYL